MLTIEYNWVKVIFLAIIVGLIILALTNMGLIMKNIHNLFAKNSDEYGGATPEETLNLFITSLRDNDVTGASMYFTDNKREAWAKVLGEYNKQNILNIFASEIESSLKNGNYRDYIQFEKNTNGVWKIKEM